MRRLAAIVLALTLAVHLHAQQPDPRELIRQSFAQDENIFNSLREYTYIEDETERNFDKRGKVTSVEREKREVLFLYGQPYEKLIAKNDKPLSAKDAAKEEEKLERESNKRRRDAERGKKREDELRARRRKAAREIPDAFDFKLVGVEQVSGQPAWVIDATPRKGYKPKTREGKLFIKTSGRLWIEQSEKSLAKAEIRVDDTISFGLFLFRLKPGARIEFERERLAANTWVPKHSLVKGEAKIGMVKTFRIEVETAYSDYKRFSTDSTITAAEAVE